MELISLYPYDSTGQKPSNRIVNETVTIVPPTQVKDYSYVIPRAAPFFVDSLVVKDGKTAGARTLVENVDYWCVIDFLSASAGLGKRICTGIALMDPSYSGTLYITYQTLGGNYSLADRSILEELIRARYVVKHVSYEQLVNLPAGFAPDWHKHTIGDMVSMSSVVDTLKNVKIAIDGRSGSYGQLNQMFNNHINGGSAHSPDQVGLGNVKNYGPATLSDARLGNANKYVTADVLNQYVTTAGIDTSGFLLKTEAANLYATKTSLSSYLTVTAADGKYALKSDTYTKSQVDALVNGIDVSDGLSGFYTKTESDMKYLPKTDIGAYIKETVADARYATQTQSYTKVESDNKYALKTQSYTKVESDGRYLSPTNLSSSLTAYLLKTEASSLYITKTEHQRDVDALNRKVGFIKDISFTPSTKTVPAQIVINEDRNGVNTAHKTNLTFLDDYLKTTDTYTLAQLQTHLNSLKTAIIFTALTFECKFTGVGQLSNGQTFPVTWICSHQGNRFDFTIYNNVAFYGREGSVTVRSSDFNFAAYKQHKYQMRNFNTTLSSTNTVADNWFRGFNDSYMYWYEGINQIGVDTSYAVASGNKNDYVDVRCYNVNFSITATDKVTYDRLYNFMLAMGEVTTYVPPNLNLEFK